MKIRILNDYSLINMMAALQKYRRENCQRKRENFGGTSGPAFSILGLSLTVFILLFVICLAIWIWALYLLIKNASTMPLWAVIISIVCLFVFSGGPIVTIILCYATKGTKHKVDEGMKYQQYTSSEYPRYPTYEVYM